MEKLCVFIGWLFQWLYFPKSVCNNISTHKPDGVNERIVRLCLVLYDVSSSRPHI